LFCNPRWRNPAALNVSTPLFDDWFQTLFEHATLSSTSKEALLHNPLAPLVDLLAQFSSAHSVLVLGKSIQLRATLFQEEGMPACSYEPHLRGHVASGQIMPPILYPTTCGFDERQGNMRYHRVPALAQQAEATQPMSQWRVTERLPSTIIKAHFFDNLQLW
jgi:hypothetical protein